MKPNDLVTFFGSQLGVERATGIRQSTVAGWVKEGRIPYARQKQLEELTGGKLAADPEAWREEVPAPRKPTVEQH